MKNLKSKMKVKEVVHIYTNYKQLLIKPYFIKQT